MIFEKVKSEGIAHNSYFIGSGLEATVIDPRRDCSIYLQIAKKQEVNITRIFETHLNEDFVVGSVELSSRVGADIYHGAKRDFSYGMKVQEGDKFNVGTLELEIHETPGHTDESISITLKDKEVSGDPHMVFTGDTLFAGEVGRTDLYGEKDRRRLSGAMYDSLFDKILQLGDEVIVCPAHGAGSVCGRDIANLEFTTIGFEKKNNRVLKKSAKTDFIEYKMREKLDRPPYFTRMEKYNKDGAPLLRGLPYPRALAVKEFKEQMKRGAQILDTRMPTSYAGGHIPGSINIWKDGLPVFAGWVLSYDKPIILIRESDQNLDEIVRYLVRLGYDNIVGYLAKSFPTWYKSAEKVDTTREWTAHDLKARIDDKSLYLLDVRDDASWEEDGYIEGAHHVYVGYTKERLNDIPKNRQICIVCDSGFKTSVASSVLKMNGYENVTNVLGGMMAWRKAGYQVKKE
ncbi:MAG: MBL fold metallo-hydrolase [Promethearchaeati archaeon SRVP18_Atabeyarchaeia-1]